MHGVRTGLCMAYGSPTSSLPNSILMTLLLTHTKLPKAPPYESFGSFSPHGWAQVNSTLSELGQLWGDSERPPLHLLSISISFLHRGGHHNQNPGHTVAPQGTADLRGSHALRTSHRLCQSIMVIVVAIH